MKLGIKGSKNEHKIKGQQYMTLMFITDATKNTKSIKIPKWIRFPLLIAMVLIVLGSLSLYEYIVGLEALIIDNNRIAEEILIDSESKDLTISQLEEELNTTKETRYDQLLQLKDLAVTLGLRLNELEEYRDEMEVFKEEIDTNLSTTEESSKETEDELISDTKESNDGSYIDIDSNMLVENSLIKDELLKLQINPIDFNVNLSTSSLKDNIAGNFQGGPVYQATVDLDSVDFEQEIDKINSYLDLALGEVESGEDEFLETTEALGDIIPYVEAYPSILPIEDTYVTSYFGYRRNPFGGYSSEFHSGVDLKAYYEPIKATGAGVVIESKYLSGYGYTVIIDHGYGITTKYAHNSKLYVSVGDEVVRGDIISKSGSTGRSTGPHLHYEVLIDGEPQNPLDFIYEEININEN